MYNNISETSYEKLLEVKEAVEEHYSDDEGYSGLSESIAGLLESIKNGTHDYTEVKFYEDESGRTIREEIRPSGEIILKIKNDEGRYILVDNPNEVSSLTLF